MSIRVAPAGILTAAAAPTAAMRPFVITMVAWKRRAPVPSITRPPVSAMVPAGGRLRERRVEREGGGREQHEHRRDGETG